MQGAITKEFVDLRQESIIRDVASSSPALVWSASDGILIMSLTKDKRYDRIHKVHDRIASVTRGKTGVGYKLREIVTNFSDIHAFNYSKEDVSTRLISRLVSEKLQESFENPFVMPIKADILLVQIAPEQDKDYFAHVQCTGIISTFDGAYFYGFLGAPKIKETTGSRRLLEPSLLFEKLQRVYRPDIPVAAVREVLETVPEFKEEFLAPREHRLEQAMLDRRAVVEQRYEQVFKRL